VSLGNFFGSDTSDMLLRNASTGGFEVYDISNNLITNAAFLGTVGLNWQVMGFGNFSSAGENDMILRNSGTGGVEVYDIRNNQITGAAFLGTVGLNWQFSGVGNFSSRGESDLLLRNVNAGGLQLYDISNNQITGAFFLGTVGIDWQLAGVAPVHAAGAPDLVLRNVNTGAFEVYNIANNQLTGAASLGQVGLDWQLGGFAADSPSGSTGGNSILGDFDQLDVHALHDRGNAGHAAAGTRIAREQTRKPVTLLARWPRLKHSSDRAMTENALRCCLHISSVSCGSAACDYAGRAGRNSSSRWQQSLRTCAGWPN
jgi:hypothetical protein